MKVIIRKIAENAAADFKSHQWDNFVQGVSNPGLSLPIDYEIKGTLMDELKVGSTISCLRTERNGIPAIGVFFSSVVLEIKTSGKLSVVKTRNSIYTITEE